jgi:hypothetical protein
MKNLIVLFSTILNFILWTDGLSSDNPFLPGFGDLRPLVWFFLFPFNIFCIWFYFDATGKKIKILM